MSSSQAQKTEQQEALTCLAVGEIEVVGQFTWGSNYTFLARVECDGQELESVYKPVRGEQPLWDFPAETLAGREVAAYLLSETLGWSLVPPTVLRQDGPAGPGSLQLRVEHDPELHYFTFDEQTKQRLRPVALFDILANNADRKGGHILLDADERLWLIDHGICFHAEPKLRTVVWDFVRQPLLDEERADIEALLGKLAAGGELEAEFRTYLSDSELDALRERADALLAAGVFPAPPEGERAVPWPPV